jgi:hypothetical protein
MTARVATRILTIAGFMMVFWAGSTADVLAQGPQASAGQAGAAGGVTVNAMKDGKVLRVRAMALRAGTKMKEGVQTAFNSTEIELDDDYDNKKAAVYINDFGDGSAGVLFVVDGTPLPQEFSDPQWRRISEVVLRRGARFIVDVAGGKVTDRTPPETQQPLNVDPAVIPFVSGLFSHNVVGTNTNFCVVNATLLNTAGFDQNSCGVKAGSSEVGVSGGFLFRFLRNATRMSLAGGRKPFGRNRPQAAGSRPNVRVTRDAVEEIVGTWVGVGVQLAGHRVYTHALAGMAYLTRDNSSTDTFTQSVSGQVLQATTRTSRDKDTKPYFEVEAGLKIRRGVGVGVVYSFTQFEDPQKKQNLHGTSVVVRFEPTTIFR